MIHRQLAEQTTRLAKQYPVVTVIGPRQSGKTVMCRNTFSNYSYVSLEGHEERQRAIRDPKGFLNALGEHAIIDEIQNAPEILSYIQTIVDEKRENGLYILTGSQQLNLMAGLTQSLAGRTAIVKLLPFTIKELYDHHKTFLSLEEYFYKGFYPRIYDHSLNASEAYSFYVNTYLERDIRSMINIKDYIQFDRFLKICASRSGQILNLSSLGNECGISHHTVIAWISILEATFIVYRVYPHFNNFSKRLVKAPKFYFHDVGLMCYLLGIDNPQNLKNHPLKGAMFETLVVGELLKHRYNSVKESNLYYFRDNAGHEVDILMDTGVHCNATEIKLSETVHPDFFKDLKYYHTLQNKEKARLSLVYGGTTDWISENVEVCSYRNLDKLI